MVDLKSKKCKTPVPPPPADSKAETQPKNEYLIKI